MTPNKLELLWGWIALKQPWYLGTGTLPMAAAVEAPSRRVPQHRAACIAANRLLVHDAVYDELVSAFVARANAMTIGNWSTSPCPDLGPVIDDDRVKAVTALVDEARARGAELLTAERPVSDGGSYVAPAPLGGVPDDAGLATEEVFGPVSAVFRFCDDDEA